MSRRGRSRSNSRKTQEQFIRQWVKPSRKEPKVAEQPPRKVDP